MIPRVETFATGEDVAIHVADAFVRQLEELQARGRTPCVVLTGGRTAAKVYAAITREPGMVDWENVEVWFSDERFLPEGNHDRNFEQVQDALFSHMAFDYTRIHPMPSASDGFDNDVERAAREHSADVLAATPTSGPWFDLVLLSVGPDGHCASHFPSRAHPVDAAPVVAIHNAPKLPSTRLSMSLQTLSLAREVWFLATGTEKARAVADALTGADVRAVPAAGPRGFEQTTWFLDDAAAGLLADINT